ncbi:hypothetical protein FZ103_07455 [Streptomonospora sp. PA3]|uniref:hypothetical protein n=1 Tax=Streptomonospora sp. PA3 TaxID=2607326 RepID=UPI0012DFE6BB|nr:hypothetical protein [Streptomonospora sp. PA3]MUL41024.1 hypothetical protein [Streptomonospora sp. PA3]
MRRRLATAVTILAAAAATAVPAAPAGAAAGVLTINGTDHADPRGCHALAGGPYSVANATDQTVFILRRSDCTGEVVGVLLPGESDQGDGAGAVFAP